MSKYVGLPSSIEYRKWAKVKPLIETYHTDHSGDKYFLISYEPLVLKRKCESGDSTLYTPSHYLGGDWKWTNSRMQDGNVDAVDGSVFLENIADELVSDYLLRRDILGEDI